MVRKTYTTEQIIDKLRKAEMSLSYWQGGDGVALSTTVQPMYLVAVSKLEKMAFRMTGEEISIDRLTKKIPGLKRNLAGI